MVEPSLPGLISLVDTFVLRDLPRPESELVDLSTVIQSDLGEWHGGGDVWSFSRTSEWNTGMIIRVGRIPSSHGVRGQTVEVEVNPHVTCGAPLEPELDRPIAKE